MCKNIHNSTMSDPIYRNIPIILTGTDVSIVPRIYDVIFSITGFVIPVFFLEIIFAFQLIALGFS